MLSKSTGRTLFGALPKKLNLPNSFSYDVLNLYQTQIEPLESALVDLEIDLDNLKDTAETIDSALDSLIDEARIVNETLITVTPERLNSKLLKGLMLFQFDTNRKTVLK